MTAGHDELELKYAIAEPVAVEALLDELFPPAAGEPDWRDYGTRDRVFDTADGALLRAGYGARLREVDGRTTLGLKSDVAVEGGLHRRRELEAEATPRLRPAEWPSSEPRKLVMRLSAGRPLRERFELRQRRRERLWQSPAGSCLLSIDQIRIRHRRLEIAGLHQLEVELQSGGAEVLLGIDKAILASGLARHERRSKMAIAAELVRLHAPLRREESYAEAGRRVLGRHLERMLEREMAVRLGDPLAVKQMRVATRRMRATWRLFADVYRKADRQRYVAELRDVANRLGAVRDLDVLVELLPADDGLLPLRRAWLGDRRRAWRSLLRMLDSRAYQRFVVDHREFVATGEASTRRSMAAVELRERAAASTWSAYRDMLRHEPRLVDGDVATLHALRISAKRLRYALETFRELMPDRTLADVLERLTEMQDHLGALNDADVAAARATAWLNEGGAAQDPGARAGVESFLADQRRELARLQGAFPRTAWKRVGSTTFRRRLARAVEAI